MPDLARRSGDTELMDTEPVSAEDFRRCLADLATVNRLSLGHRPTLRFLRRATRTWPRGRRLALLDVGYGYGDTLRAIRAWGRRRGFALDLVGIDLNPSSAAAARGADDEPGIAYLTADLFGYAPDRPFDFVVSALFTHHLGDTRIEAFLRWMEGHARCGWFVNDLHRHAIAYHGFRAIAAAMRWHRFVRHDGPVSIARGFRRADWRARLAAAGLPAAGLLDAGAGQGPRIVWHLPFRLCVERLR